MVFTKVLKNHYKKVKKLPHFDSLTGNRNVTGYRRKHFFANKCYIVCVVKRMNVDQQLFKTVKSVWRITYTQLIYFDRTFWFTEKCNAKLRRTVVKSPIKYWNDDEKQVDEILLNNIRIKNKQIERSLSIIVV